MLFFNTAIFDLDGTLLNTLTDLTNAVNHTLDAYGYPRRTKQEIRRFLGNGSQRLISDSLPPSVSPEEAKRVHADYLLWYDSHAAVETAPYPGITELLNRLKEKNISLAVVSNKGDAQVRTLTEKHFPQVNLSVGERTGIRRKPAPDSIFEIMKQFNADPETTILVGDSEVDIQTAKNAGIFSVAVGWGFRDKEELLQCSPDLFLDHPLDLLR